MNSISKTSSIIQIWDKVPWEGLPLSAKVDICQLISGIKPAVRLHIQNREYLETLISLFRSLSWHSAQDTEGYVVISNNKHLPHTILSADQDPFPHEVYLGTLLGYPSCCCEYISQHGESQIDRLAESFKKEDLTGEFKIIDISFYNKGIALLSHVPCSYKCFLSLQMANSLKNFIQSSDIQGDFLSWCKEVKNYFNF
jgi:hypothetical protein